MPPSILRTAHGNGAGALLRAERPPIDELEPLNADDTGRGLAIRSRRGRPFQPGNSAASGRKPSLCLLGVPLETSDPRYRSALRKAKAYAQRRSRELSVQHGGVMSAGASAVLAGGARAMAASVLLYELAGELLDPNLFKLAASLADSARQAELTCIAIMEREREERAPKPLAAKKDPILSGLLGLAFSHAGLIKDTPPKPYKSCVSCEVVSSMSAICPLDPSHNARITAPGAWGEVEGYFECSTYHSSVDVWAALPIESRTFAERTLGRAFPTTTRR